MLVFSLAVIVHKAPTKEGTKPHTKKAARQVQTGVPRSGSLSVAVVHFTQPHGKKLLLLSLRPDRLYAKRTCPCLWENIHRYIWCHYLTRLPQQLNQFS